MVHFFSLVQTGDPGFLVLVGADDGFWNTVVYALTDVARHRVCEFAGIAISSILKHMPIWFLYPVKKPSASVSHL